jgi:hypothetical protein
MLFSYVSAQQQIDNNFDCHADAAVRRGAHRPMEHIQGFHLKPLDAAIGQPQQPPWSTNSNETHYTLTKHNF